MIDEARSFGTWLKQCRKALDLTQAELAQRIGCSVRTIEKFETGERRPSKQLVALLIHHLQIPPDEHAAFLQRARVQPVPAQPKPAPPPQTPAKSAIPSHPHNLPAPPTALVGRKTEMETACALLRRPYGRLLTLTGPGGIGKTRLALEVASELLDDFPDGAFFVPLAPLADPALVLSTLAWTLGIKEQQGEAPLDSLKRELRTKQLLLVLDNFEHLLPAAVHVAELLAACSALKVLVTSREVLRLRGEKELSIPPLTLPDATELASAEHAYRSEAVRLFVERAQDARLDFTLDDASAAAVAEVCVRLEGLPLAIELAAARIKRFTPEAMLERLGSPLQLATGAFVDLPVRQQTLRDAIAWSYDLLNEAEQRLFRCLGVFAGDFTAEAAHAVDGSDSTTETETLRGLESLVDKSLLQYARGHIQPEEPRFRMLETIREYAVERLEASGIAAAVRDRHARYYLDLAEHGEPEIRGAQRKQWLDRFDKAHDNFRAALRWSLDKGDAEWSLRFSAALTRFWYYRAHMTEGRRWLAEALSRIDAVDTELQAKAYRGAGVLAWGMGDLEAAQTFYEKGLAIWRELGDARRIASTLYDIAGVLVTNTQYQEARPILEEVLPIFRDLDQKDMVSSTLNRLSIAAEHGGDLQLAKRLCEESLAIDVETGDTRHAAIMKSRLGYIALQQGALVQADRLFREGLLVFRELGDKDGIVSMLEWLGAAAQALGRTPRAAQLFGAADALRKLINIPWSRHDRALYEPYLGAVRAELDEATWEQAWAAGQAMTMGQAVEYALGGS